MNTLSRRIATTLGALGAVVALAGCPGTIVVTAEGPTAPPPEPQYETPRETRAGHVWVKGRYVWRGGRYVWQRGSWQRVRSGQTWQPGKWVQRGNRWVWVRGRWVGGGTVVVTGPTSAPPPPAYEQPEPRPGQVWIRGRYQWKNGKWTWQSGRWQTAQANKRWVRGRWVSVNGRWTWRPGRWVVVGTWGGTVRPPTDASRRWVVNPRPRAGYIWVKGRYRWNGSQWVWNRGHYKKIRTGKRWQRGKWVLRGNRWVWQRGRWVRGAGGTGTVVVTGPASRPPPALYEQPDARPGQVWIRGRYEWKNGRWTWKRGRWQTSRRNQRWVRGSWANVNGRWSWKPGRWVVTGSWGGATRPPHRRFTSLAPQPRPESWLHLGEGPLPVERFSMGVEPRPLQENTHRQTLAARQMDPQGQSMGLATWTMGPRRRRHRHSRCDRPRITPAARTLRTTRRTPRSGLDPRTLRVEKRSLDMETRTLANQQTQSALGTRQLGQCERSLVMETRTLGRHR